jgi:tetratricopeptide (TPR) repeat protein
MSSGENAETWLDKGAEAYAEMRIAEAGQNFEKAVAADPHSARAHLCLGVTLFFQYQNGIGEALNEMDLAGERHRLTREQWQARAERRRAQIAEQNAGNAANAEAHLRRAVECETDNQPSIEYLAALYYAVLDPVTEHTARPDDAKLWYARLLEINPQHPFANYMCGVIDYQTAFPTIRSNAGFPSPLTDDSRCRSLRAQTGPLLTESARNFLRSLEIDPKSTQAMIYLMLVKRDQACIAETENEVVRDRAEADALEHKVYEIIEANAKANTQPWPPGNTASVTFVRVPRWSTGGNPPVPRFPPDARLMTVPLAPPPPPPPPPSSARR